ncbi:Glycine oxidase [Methylobrevis pamukkalensis]|uniref:Glycine oxidase n=1 Tax=Methylobrevis pamukkalensis TaxID=1439726 RepID=A0A1E3GYB1_9HYPH|nr:Glycine oxidase [Methylobrevis pamukkalensis]
MKVFRSDRARDDAFREADRLTADFRVNHVKLTGAEVAAAEPALVGGLAGGLRWSDPWSIRDPYSLVRAYVALFEKLGGTVMSGDAATVEAMLSAKGWRVATPEGPVEATDVVVALGPWADTVTRKLGYRFPLAVKRGYHMHYRPKDGAVLNNWVLDTERGYFLAPMQRGIRLTTGAEFARRDAPKTPVQLERAEKVARDFFPLGERVDLEPWMGSRPCTPDMMPVIGKAPQHDGLWFAFGHAHHGLTLGPITAGCSRDDDRRQAGDRSGAVSAGAVSGVRGLSGASASGVAPPLSLSLPLQGEGRRRTGLSKSEFRFGETWRSSENFPFIVPSPWRGRDRERGPRPILKSGARRNPPQASSCPPFTSRLCPVT